MDSKYGLKSHALSLLACCRIYKRLWERKVRLDIADAILIVDGTPQFWFFTSSTTGVRVLFLVFLKAG